MQVMFEQLESRMFLSGDSAVLAGPAAAEGSHPAVAQKLSRAVAAKATTTKLALSKAAAALGQFVKLTATVTTKSGAIPTGTVQFRDGSALLGSATLNSHGKASGNVSTLFIGAHAIIAKYVGDTNFKASRSAKSTLTIKTPKTQTLEGGLQIATTRAGTGKGAVNNQSLHVNYTGFLTDGTKFDSSLNPGRDPFDFELGTSSVIQGWDKGLLGIKVGEQRVLIIPPELGYGEGGQGSIPGNATLIFIVQLLSFNQPKLAVDGKDGLTISNDAAPSAASGTEFGDVAVGDSSVTTTIQLSNAGDAGLHFTNNPGEPQVQISGTDAADFTLTHANNSATFTITFNPAATGRKTARITIPTNDPDFPNYSFDIAGTGI